MRVAAMKCISMVLVLLWAGRGVSAQVTPADARSLRSSDTAKVVGSRRPVSAKVLSIKGNVVTIVDGSGATRTFEVASLQGVEVGASAGWCEDDCRTVEIGGQTVPVKRLLPTDGRTGYRDPENPKNALPGAGVNPR